MPKHFIVGVCLILFSAPFSLSAEKIPGTDLEEKVFELALEEREVSTRSFTQLEQQVDFLNEFIGSYPPRFDSEEQRQQIYMKWLDLASDAEAYAKTTDGKEKGFYILAEVYRQGHNMDVMDSAEKAHENLNLCLLAFPESISCNLSASYFYLSTGPLNLDLAENSLNVLREQYYPELDPEVEAGFVFLYLYRQDVPKVKKQIDYFLANFPDNNRAYDFLMIRDELGENITWIEE